MIPTVSRRRIAATIALLVAVNALAWVWAGNALHDHPVLLGTAFLAWVFGLRHGIDADHIAAIDNVVRKLVHHRRHAWDSGLFFALGHSATVLLLCVGIAAFPAVSGIEHLGDLAGGIRAGLWGQLVSAVFLVVVGLFNLRAARQVWRARHNAVSDTLLPGGAMSRMLRPVRRLVGRSWHMVPVGFMFGLGFDTASEVALLVVTAQQAAAGLSPGDVLIFPALFAAGMILVDTADSAVMTGAYAWALHEPSRKLGYNLVVTALSAVVAVGVGGIELLGLLAEQAPNTAGRIPFIAWLPDAVGGPFTGFVVVAALLALWGIAALASRSRNKMGLSRTRIAE
jgi:high-affinity nickel-transport protein